MATYQLGFFPSVILLVNIRVSSIILN